MKVMLFPWNGSMRLQSQIVIGEARMTPREFLIWATTQGLDPSPVLNQLQSVVNAPNVVHTPGSVEYHQACLIVAAVDTISGKVNPLKLWDPDMIKGLNPGFTHAHDLRHGRVCTIDLMDTVKDNPWKLGKRLKLFTGFMVKGYHPLPTTIGDCEDSNDCGVIYVSKEYAGKFHLVTNNSPVATYHNMMPKVLTAPLMNGDKLGGTLPNGWIVKGSVAIRDQIEDMVVPEDALKVKGGTCNINTRMYVKSRAKERVNTRGARLSYQIGQFYPELVHDIVRDRLEEPWRISHEYASSTEGATWYDMIAGTAPISEYIELLTYEVNGELRRQPAGDILAEFANNNPPDQPTEWAQRMVRPTITQLSTGVGLNNHRVKSVVQAVLRSKLDDLINTGVKGVWGVVMPHSYDRDTISVPRDLWYYLDCPEYVAAIRYPVKGKSSLVRLKCFYHNNGYDIRVHHDIIDVVWGGDFDGDVICVVASPNWVDAAMDPDVAYSICKSCREEVKLKLDPIVRAMKSKMSMTIDKRYAQCLVARWRGAVALATTMRDNLNVKLRAEAGVRNWSNEDIERMLIRFMEGVMQPALAQMDGDVPVAQVLMGDPSASKGTTRRRGRPDVISQLTGIPAELLVNSDGETDRWASAPLNELRKANHRMYQSTMYSLMSIAQEEPGSNPHLRILRAFKDIKPW
jgi:hypothetical protein